MQLPLESRAQHDRADYPAYITYARHYVMCAIAKASIVAAGQRAATATITAPDVRSSGKGPA